MNATVCHGRRRRPESRKGETAPVHLAQPAPSLASQQSARLQRAFRWLTDGCVQSSLPLPYEDLTSRWLQGMMYSS